MTQVQDTLVLRPNRRKIATALAFAVVAGVVTSLGTWTRWSPTAGAVTGAVFAVLLIVMAVHSSRSAIILTPEELIEQGFGYRRRRPRARITRVIRAVVLIQGAGPHEIVYLLGTDDRVVMRLYGTHYAHRDLDRLMHTLGVPVQGPGRPVTHAELERFHPGILSLTERRPLLIGFSIMGGLLLLILLAALTAVALGYG